MQKIEMILDAMIKWASTLANQVSKPSSAPNGKGPIVIDPNTIPKSSSDGEVW